MGFLFTARHFHWVKTYITWKRKPLALLSNVCRVKKKKKKKEPIKNTTEEPNRKWDENVRKDEQLQFARYMLT